MNGFFLFKYFFYIFNLILILIYKFCIFFLLSFCFGPKNLKIFFALICFMYF